MTARAYAALLALAALAGGAWWVWQHGQATGAARVQAAWDKERALQAQQLAQAQDAARRDEAARFRNAERIASEQAHQERDLQVRAARAESALRGLRDAVYALDTGANLPGTPGDAGIAAAVGAARAARGLLAACSERYAAVAADADRFVRQITGLQQFAAQVCGAAPLDSAPITDTRSFNDD